MAAILHEQYHDRNDLRLRIGQGVITMISRILKISDDPPSRYGNLVSGALKRPELLTALSLSPEVSRRLTKIVKTNKQKKHDHDESILYLLGLCLVLPCLQSNCLARLQALGTTTPGMKHSTCEIWRRWRWRLLTMVQRSRVRWTRLPQPAAAPSSCRKGSTRSSLRYIRIQRVGAVDHDNCVESPLSRPPRLLEAPNFQKDWIY